MQNRRGERAGKGEQEKRNDKDKKNKDLVQG